MTTNAPTTPQAISLDDALSRIDAQLLGVTTMTTEQLTAHVAAELTKSVEETAAGKAELAKARLAHLKEQTTLAKAIFDKGATLAPIVMFKDPWQTMPGATSTKTADIPQPAISPTGNSNIQFENDVVFVTTEKGAREPSPLVKALIVVAKASSKSPAHTKLLAKAGGAEIIAKAGEAHGILSTIAVLFGISLESPDDVLDCEFRWDIGDVVSALQSAAKLEGVMAQMSGMMSATAKGSAPAPATPPAPPAPAPAAQSEAWPTDMANATLDEKTGTMKSTGDESGTPYWGWDSGTVPTT